jgi:hypothetical protein
MLINELNFYELKRIITPVIGMQPMSHIVSEIGQVLGIPKATARKIQNQEQFSLRYKGFEAFVSDLRWLRDRGPSIHLQFRRRATKWEVRQNVWLGESNKRLHKICGEIAQDLQSICLEEMADIKLTWTDITLPPDRFSNQEGRFRIAHPQGAYNDEAKVGYESSPLNVGEDYNPAGPNWFVSLFFNGACFVRRDGKTRLRGNWREHANDVSDSIDAEVARMTHFSGHNKTFEEWSEDMIGGFGDEIIPSLPAIWKELHKPPAQREEEKKEERSLRPKM